MASPCEVLIESPSRALAKGVADAVARCAWRIEAKFSRYREDSAVSAINRSAGRPVPVDEETANLLDFAARMHELSDGMFDITSGALRRVWRFDGGSGAPTAQQLADVLARVGWRKASWHRPFFTLRAEMEIDFGGIGKEYAVDQAVQIAAGLSDAAVLVNFGGDLAVTRAREGDNPWRVGVESADVATRTAGLIDLHRGALATSGDTYRFVQMNGERLPHILDPRDGLPIRGAPHSVTVAAPTCTHAGMLSTLAMLKGSAAEEFLRGESVRHWIQR